MSQLNSILKIILPALLLSCTFFAIVHVPTEVVAQSDDEYTISGTVRDFDGTVISNASVTTFGDPVFAFGSSDDTGRYTLTVPAGTYNVRALKIDNGATTSAIPVTVPPSKTDIDLTFLESFTVSGQVTDSDGNPVEGANVSTDLDDPMFASATTDEDGNYVLLLVEGTYTIRVFKEGIGGQLEMTLTVQDDISGFDFMFPRSYQITGTVNDENGEPLSDVTIFSGFTITRTDENGLYTAIIGEDDSRLSAAKNGYVRSEFFLIPGGKDHLGVDIVLLKEDRTITGIITDQDGEPLADVDVWASNLDGNFFARPFDSTDETGRYTLTTTSGLFWLTAAADGYVPSLPAEIDQRDESSEYDMALMPAALSISGTVKDADGMPVPNVSVSAETCGIGYRESTDDDGAFTILASADTFNVSAYDADYGDSNEIMVSIPPTTADLELVFSTLYTVVGRVTDNQGNGLFNVDIDAWDDETYQSWDADTDANGVFTMTMSSGTYEFSIEEKGYARAIQDDIVVDGDRQGIDFQLSPLPWDQSIQGSVIDDAGNPVSGIYLEARLISGQGWSSSREAYYDGSFLIELPAGTYSVVANGFFNGYSESDAQEVTLPGDSASLTFQVDRTDQLITGQLVDADGVPICGQVITTAGEFGSLDFSKRNGLFALRVPAGSHTVQLEDGSTVLATEAVTVPPYALGIELRIDEGVTAPSTFMIAGVVQDTAGQPVDGATVEATSGSESVTATTSADGTYALSLTPGTWTVTVQKSGYTSFTGARSIDLTEDKSDVTFSIVAEPSNENPDPENPDPENPDGGGNPISPEDQIDLFLPLVSS